MMASVLTEDQIAQIARNREAALQRRRECQSRKRAQEEEDNLASQCLTPALKSRAAFPTPPTSKRACPGKEGEGKSKGIAVQATLDSRSGPTVRTGGGGGGKVGELDQSWIDEGIRLGDMAKTVKVSDMLGRMLDAGAQQTYGPSTTDHQLDKVYSRGYYEMRNADSSKKGAALRERQSGDGAVYRRIAASLRGLGESEEYEPRGLFRGVNATVNGYTGAITDVHIKSLIQLEGGEVSWVFAKRGCTHIVSSSLSGGKVDKILHGAGKFVVVVTPEWVIDSIKQARSARIPR